MNAEPEDFNQLCRLLKLKRHESPPPRYFNDFAGQVLSRIRTNADGGRISSFEDIIAQSPWVQRFWEAIENRPAVSGMFAAAVSGLLIVGTFLSDRPPQSLSITANGTDRVEAAATGQLGQGSLAAAPIPDGSALFGSSSNPAVRLNSGPSLFGDFPKLGDPQRVNGIPIGSQ